MPGKIDLNQKFPLWQGLIAILFVALLAIGLFYPGRPHDHDRRKSFARASMIARGVAFYIHDHGPSDPSEAWLAAAESDWYLPMDRGPDCLDGWDRPFSIAINGDSVEVLSLGRDGVPSDDDIVASDSIAEPTYQKEDRNSEISG